MLKIVLGSLETAVTKTDRNHYSPEGYILEWTYIAFTFNRHFKDWGEMRHTK